MNPGAFIALIPARRASSRLPNKALLDIAGLPMVVPDVESFYYNDPIQRQRAFEIWGV